jgi:hypothetical protein
MRPGSCPCRVATMLCQSHNLTASFGRYSLQLLAPGLDWLPAANIRLQLSIRDWVPSWTNWLPTGELTKWKSVGQFVLVSSTHLGSRTRYLLLSDSCGVVDVGSVHLILRRSRVSIFAFTALLHVLPVSKTTQRGMIGWWMNWEGSGSKLSWTEVLSQHLHGGAALLNACKGKVVFVLN